MPLTTPPRSPSPSTTPPLCLLHGWGLGSAWWQPLQQAWTAGAVTALDLPGYGEGPEPALASAPARDEATCRAELRACAQHLVNTTLPGSVVCAWSLGALVALEAAQIAPQHWSGLVLVGATPCFLARDGWPQGTPDTALASLVAQVQAKPSDALRRFSAQVLHGSSQARALARTWGRLPEPLPPRPDTATLLQGLAWLAWLDLRDTLAQIQLPTLLIHGRQDAVVPVAAGQWMAEHLPHATWLPLDDAGHAPFLTHPGVMVTAIESHLATCSGPRPSTGPRPT